MYICNLQNILAPPRKKLDLLLKCSEKTKQNKNPPLVKRFTDEAKKNGLSCKTQKVE